MRIHLVGLVLAASTVTARADVFAFKDLDGFEKCMQLDHLVETVKTANGSQTRVLRPDEIQERCVAAAVPVLQQAKSKDMAMDFVKATRRLSAPVNALDLIGVLADLSIASCNDIEVYGILMMPLDNEPGKYLTKDKPVIKRCLKDKDFVKDFLEEKDSYKEHRAQNACQILLEEKLVKSCKGGKP